MDRKHYSPPSIPPGFGGNVLNSIPSASSPVNIPHPLAMKSLQSRNIFNFHPAIAASAPTETIPYVDMLLNSSTERRSLSPHRKIAGLQNDRVRVLSCSDLESTLTNRSPESSRSFLDFPPPPPIPIFHHHSPIQACSPPRFVQSQVKRMPIANNFPPLIIAQQTGGQQINRTIQAPVRPPPGFEVPLLNTPPSPLTPPQFPSPQPWSPARLAPMFHKNDSIESKVEQDVKSLGGGAQVQSTPLPFDRNRNNKRLGHSDKRNGSNLKPYREQIQTKARGRSSELDGNHKPYDANSNHRSIERQVSNESSSSGKKVKKKKKRQKKDKKKSKNDTETYISISENGTSEPSANAVLNIKKGLSTDESDGPENGVIHFNESEDEIMFFTENDGDKLQKLRKKFKNLKWVEKFEPYLSAEEVEHGLANKTLIESVIRINHKNYKEAYVSNWENGQDIIIVGMKDRNRSLDGDVVVVKIKDKIDWPNLKRGGQFVPQMAGKVVFIKERVHHRNTVGKLYRIDTSTFVLVPRDARFPLLRIRQQCVPVSILESANDILRGTYLFKASIVSWFNTEYANGILKKNLGKKGMLSVETAAILEELGLDSKPVPHFKKLVPSLPYEIAKEEITSRLDLRSEIIFTIDPPTARDLDDAVSIKKLSDDKFQVGVHISDVSHFLQEGTKLDKMVSNRATTVYMVEETFHMLPITLCALCSLNPGEDKLTISVIMTISKDGVVLDKQIKRSVIHSCAQLNYDQVQDVIDGKDADFPEIRNNIDIATIKEAILQLNELAIAIRTKRFDSGALKINQPKLCFSLDEDDMPNSLAVYEIKDSHNLIEEYMLLANESVARFIYDAAPDVALLRKHDPPKHDMMSRLQKNLNEIGICLDSSSSGNLHSSLSRYCEDDEMKAHILYHLCAKPMKRAVYFCSSPDTHHYALNKDKYTHFTSPIRRYADIIVHRVLTACLGLSPMPAWDSEKVNKFASVCNRKKYFAKRAGELSCDLFRTLYLKQVRKMIVDAVVLCVTYSYLHIIVPSLAYITRIPLDKIEYVRFEVVDKEMNSMVRIKWPGVDEIQELQIFSTVKVKLAYKSSKSEIVAVLLPPPNSPS